MVEERFYQGLGSRRDEKSKRQGMKKLKAPEGRRKAGKLQGKKRRKKNKKPFRIEIRIRDISVRKLCTRSIFLNTTKRTVLCASKNSRMIDNKIIEISLHGFNLKTYGPS